MENQWVYNVQNPSKSDSYWDLHGYFFSGYVYICIYIYMNTVNIGINQHWYVYIYIDVHISYHEKI